MIAVDMNEARGPAKRFCEFARAERARARPQRRIALASEPMMRAILVETLVNSRIGPVETVESERPFAVGKSQRHGDEEPTFERPNPQKLPADVELGLPAHHVAANRRGEPRLHAENGFVAFL